MKTGTEMAHDFESFINSANQEDLQEFVEGITRGMHRTLQQKTMGAVCTLIRAWANCAGSEGDYDLRNEATVKLCRKICEKFDKYDMMLPLI